MGMGLLFLALVPLAFLPAMMPSPDDDLAEDPLAGDDASVADGAASSGDLLDGPDHGDQPDDQPDAGSDDGAGDDGSARAPDVLAPLDEDDSPADPPQPVDEASIVAPLDENDVAGAGDGPDHGLLPIDDIDSDNVEYWLSPADDGGIGHVEIDSFDPGQDVLQVILDPALVEGTLDVDVQLSDDGQDSLVYVENQLIAVLKGATGVSPASIQVHLEQIAA